MAQSLSIVRASAARAAGSSRVRACLREDLPEVADLYEAVWRSGSRSAPPGLAPYFERIFFDCPWAEPEVPPLVHEHQGRITAFVGSHVRRFRLDGKPLLLSCGGQLVGDPQSRKPAGAMLVHARLRGKHDATFADGANETARRIWEICGGEVALLKSFAWTRVLRPARFAALHALRRLGRPARLPRAMERMCAPLDAAALRLAGRRLRPAAPETTREPLTAAAILENHAALTRHLRLVPDYDQPYLDWLFREMAAVRSRGTLVRCLVRGRDGDVAGWYVYYLDAGGVSQVHQVAAKRGRAGAVLDDLLDHAFTEGAAAVQGRVEPQLVEALSLRRCIYGWSGSAMLHCRNPELAAVLLSGRCWLGRMDGESWMGHHTETFA